MNNILVIGKQGQLAQEFLKVSATTALNIQFCSSSEIDVKQYDLVEKAIETYSPDFVISCAAYTWVDKAEQEFNEAMMVNEIGALNVAKACCEKNVRMVHFSTDYVFDGNRSIPYNEDDEANPISVYGKTKLKGENLVQQYNKDALIIRTSWLYSLKGNNFLKTMIRLSHEKDRIEVVYDQVGTPTFAGDVAKFVVSYLENVVAGHNKWFSGVFHYGNEGISSWYDFAIEIMDQISSSCSVKPICSAEYPTLARRPSYSVLSKSKIKCTFGIEISHWKHSLRNCLNDL